MKRSTSERDGVDVMLMTVNFGVHLMQEPYGIAILSSLLKRRGFTTFVLEPGVDALRWQDCLDIIRERRPRILGISLLFDGAIEAVTELIGAARCALTGLNVFLGGQAVTTGYALPAYRQLVGLCDAILVGEAELSAPEYVGKVLAGESGADVAGVAYSDGGQLVVNRPAPRIEDLDQVPLQDRTVLRQLMRKHPQYRTAAVQAGRGCASSCSFCSYGTLTRLQHGQRKLRRKSFAGIFEEIEYLYRELGTRDFHIEDESFFENNAEHNRGLLWLAQALRSLPERISFDILARIDCIDLEATAALKAAGLTRIFVGIDSIDPDDLRLYGKGYTPEVVHDGLHKLLALGYSLDVDAEFRVQTGYITWNPYSTLRRVRNAFNFFKEYRNTPKLIQHYLFVFSGTPLKKTIESDGLHLPPGEMIGRSEVHYRFRHPEVNRLFRAMIDYFDVWSPFRDGIRMIEKKVRLELPQAHSEIAEIAELVALRRTCDAHFFTAFDNLLVHAEQDSAAPRLAEIAQRAASELHELIPAATLREIERFCRMYNMGENIIETIRSNPLALARYKL